MPSFAPITVPTAMRAIVGRAGVVTVEEHPTPTPGPGQVLVRSLACGICGSDLHMVHHYDEMFSKPRPGDPAPGDPDAGNGVLLGHELAGEVVDHGPGGDHDSVPAGTRVASIPFVTVGDGLRQGVGTSRRIHGALSEYFLLDEANLIVVPDHLATQSIALAEPLAVAIHALERGDVTSDDTALVVGCGAIGLATIAALRMRGVGTIIASDPVAHRRSMAETFGATQTVDPADADEYVALEESSEPGRAVILECAGVTSLLRPMIDRAPARTRIVVVGVHTEDLTMQPAMAMRKELDLRFTFYYSPENYAEAIDWLASGDVDLAPLVTATVGIEGVDDAIQTLSGPNDHIKIIVEPWRS